MKTTDFAIYLTEFLKMHLPVRRKFSENTIKSYRDTFRFMLIFAEEQYNISAEKLTLANLTDNFVCEFLEWLENERSNSSATKKQRLAAIHSFIHFLKTRKPEYLLEYQKIFEIKVKNSSQRNIGYLSPNEVKAVLNTPDLNNRYGRRDMVLLTLLYDSAARVQEICDLCVANIRLQRPCTVSITGKGEKTRIVPIMPETANVIRTYLTKKGINTPGKQDEPLFTNHQHSKLTRAGVTYILKKYCDIVRRINPTFPSTVSPHMLRHSKAMHMLKAGANLIYIRDFLGHLSISTTQIYAKADTDMKREIIEKSSPKITPDLGDWTEDASLMAMLADLCR